MKLMDVRLRALAVWQSHTKREIPAGCNFDYYANSHECTWQDRASEYGFSHISFFCSFGTFNSHITELLTDDRFDDLEMDTTDPFISEIIFRYYERVLLIISQSLEDFEYMIGIILGITKTNKKREALGSDIGHAFNFINNINKHKKNSFHSCNHHIEIIFEDTNPNYVCSTTLSWGNPLNAYSEVYVPKLEKIIGCVLSCYDIINETFKDAQNFKKFCEKFEETSSS